LNSSKSVEEFALLLCGLMWVGGFGDHGRAY
jgi:hypothetical protein